jgi:hypothetical protein
MIFKLLTFFIILISTKLIAGENKIKSDPMNSALNIENSPYFWTQGLSYGDTHALNTVIGSDSDYELADDEVPLTQFLQKILNASDNIIRSDFAKLNPTLTGPTTASLYASTPQAKIIITSSLFNAWVSAVPVSIGAQFGYSPVENTAVLLDPGHLSLFDYDIEQFKSTKQGHWNTFDAVKFWNSGKPRCRIKLDQLSNPITLVPKTPNICIDSEAQGKETMFTSTSQFIHVSSDLLASLTSINDIIVVLTHELGHYYLGHTTDAMLARLNYWFHRDENNVSVPIKSEESEKFKEAYLEVLEKGHPQGPLPFTDNSGFSPRMRAFLLIGLTSLFENKIKLIKDQSLTDKDFPCQQAYELSQVADQSWLKDVTSSITPSLEHIKQMEKYFQLLKSCSSQLFLKDGSELTTLSSSAVFKVANSNLPGTFVKVTVQPGMSLKDFIDDLNNKAITLDQKRMRLLTQVSRNHVGLYTTEQAADEFGMVLAMKLGLTKEEVIESWFHFMAAIDFMINEVYGPGKADLMHKQNHEYNLNECHSAYLNGFSTFNSKKQPIPLTMSLGNLDDSHHATCYRIYNLWKILNIDTQKGTKQKLIPSNRAEFVNQTNWQEIQKQAKAMSGHDRRYDPSDPPALEYR